MWGEDMSFHRTQTIFDENHKISASQLDLSASLIPSFLIELSKSSMRNLRGDSFQPRGVYLPEFGLENEADVEPAIKVETVNMKPMPTRIEPISGGAPIIAVDVSSTKVGETGNGIICALRGALVLKDERLYHYVRYGPLAFHVTDQTQESLSKRLGFQQFRIANPSTTPATYVLSRLRNILERWTQRLVCSTFKNSIMLFDGSLTAGTPDNPVKRMSSILDIAKDNGNVVLAFSKATKLCVAGQRITNLLDEATPPCVLDIDPFVVLQFPSNPIQLLGRVHVAKLASGGFTFRLDVDREVPQEIALEAVGKLVGGDLVVQGYPESLRLAHILSTFTANEVIAIQRFVTQQYGLQMVPQFSLRRSLFGPFGTFNEVT